MYTLYVSLRLCLCGLLAQCALSLKRLSTGAEVISGNCLSTVGKCYPMSKTEGNISQPRENIFH